MPAVVTQMLHREYVVDIPAGARSNQSLAYLFLLKYGAWPDAISDSYITFNTDPSTIIYSTSTSIAALQTGSFTAGSVVVLNNAGKIYGMGGNGGRSASIACFPKDCSVVAATDGSAGGPAMKLQSNLIISNTGTIAGGGGGGGSGASTTSALVGVYVGCTGGGGGGGIGYYSANTGGPVGTATTGCTYPYIYSGTSGSGTTTGAGGNGGYGGGDVQAPYGVAGIVNFVGADGSDSPAAVYGAGGGGGGGGWGAAGGHGGSSVVYGAYNCPGGYTNGGAGGKSVLKNGYSLTWTATGTVYGSEGA